MDQWQLPSRKRKPKAKTTQKKKPHPAASRAKPVTGAWIGYDWSNDGMMHPGKIVAPMDKQSYYTVKWLDGTTSKVRLYERDMGEDKVWYILPQEKHTLYDSELE